MKNNYIFGEKARIGKEKISVDTIYTDWYNIGKTGSNPGKKWKSTANKYKEKGDETDG